MNVCSRTATTCCCLILVSHKMNGLTINIDIDAEWFRNRFRDLIDFFIFWSEVTRKLSDWKTRHPETSFSRQARFPEAYELVHTV